MTERYLKWEKLIYKAAIKTIGRTTFKPSGGKRVSKEIERLRNERTMYKKEFEKERALRVKESKWRPTSKNKRNWHPRSRKKGKRK